jgi:hypothetical protein
MDKNQLKELIASVIHWTIYGIVEGEETFEQAYSSAAQFVGFAEASKYANRVYTAIVDSHLAIDIGLRESFFAR